MKAPCAVEDCERLSHARGLCITHYKRALRADELPGLVGRRFEPVPYMAARLTEVHVHAAAARARLRQALIVMDHPHVGLAKGVTPQMLVDQALAELEAIEGGGPAAVDGAA